MNCADRMHEDCALGLAKQISENREDRMYARMMRQKKGEGKLPVISTMLLKTHREKMSVLGLSTIFLKTRHLTPLLHDGIDKLGTCGPPPLPGEPPP